MRNVLSKKRPRNREKYCQKTLENSQIKMLSGKKRNTKIRVKKRKS
jgi:hypothetical protein